MALAAVASQKAAPTSACSLSRLVAACQSSATPFRLAGHAQQTTAGDRTHDSSTPNTAAQMELKTSRPTSTMKVGSAPTSNATTGGAGVG